MFNNGNKEGGLELMRAQLAEAREQNKLGYCPYHATLLADALCRAGKKDEANHYLDEAMAIVEDGGERWAEPEIWRERGDLHRATNGQDEALAESCYHKAIDIARSQSAKSWELRAATRLARLWRDQGKTAEARDLLAPVYS